MLFTDSKARQNAHSQDPSRQNGLLRGGSLLHPQSALQKACCETTRPPPLEVPVCGKKLVPDECAHTAHTAHDALVV
jgi:hypothetical protein